MTLHWRFSRQAWVHGLALGLCLGLPAAAQDPQRLTLSCAVFYTPERQIWHRQVELTHDARRVLALRIDGQSPYAYSSDGQNVYTAIDNERIHIHLSSGLWRSDFRGLASGEGPCTANR